MKEFVYGKDISLFYFVLQLFITFIAGYFFTLEASTLPAVYYL